MSYKTIEQPLCNLLPSHADSLPDELVKLAATLLAQSRNYATSLKPGEEIARPHACAEIACKRLSKQLRLPPTVGRPPCPPRIYKKLYNYLDQALSKASTGSKRRGPDTTPGAAKSGAATATETTPSRPTTRRQPVKGPFWNHGQGERGNKTRQGAKSGRITDAPSWTMPIIRRICDAVSKKTSRVPLSTSSSLAPHIFAGLSSMLSRIPTLLADADAEHPYADFFSPIQTNDPDSEDKAYRERVTTLIVALYFVTLCQSRADQSADLDLGSSVEMSHAALASAGLTDDKFPQEVDRWLNILQDGLVEEEEWFKNVPRLTGKDEEGRRGGGSEGDVEDEEEVVTVRKRRALNRQTAEFSMDNDHGGLLPGLGTMMSDRVDWLSEERRADYVMWKADVMDRIKAIEQRVA